MTPVIHCSAGNISFFPRITFIQRNEIPCTKHNVAGNYTRLMSSSQRFSLAQSSLRLLHSYRSSFLSRDGSRIRSVAAAGGADLKVEEASPSVVAGSGENPDTDTKTIEAPSVTNSVETSESTSQTNSAVKSPPKSRRSRGVRRSDMPPVKNEDLTPGASFTGKVRSIQPFGAFIDFGAFTDGLVHVSRMSDGYVKDVGSLVSVGQEVKVRIVEANMETRRISLTMRDNDDVSRAPPQRRENTTGSSGSSDRPRSAARKNAPRRDEVQKSSKFVEGQVLSGTVKNIIRAGSFVSLPDGEEGFIPVDEETGGFDNIDGNSSLQVGQEVTARVLRFSRGKVTLTMKKEEVDVNELNRQLNKGGAPVATNPFMLAFRKNKDIAAFLDEREKFLKSSSENDTSLPMKTTSEQGEEDKVAGDTTTKSDTLVVEFSSNELLSDTKEQVSSLLAHDDDVGAISETSSEDNGSSTTLAGSSSDSVLDTKDSIAAVEAVEESLVSDESESVDGASITNVGKEVDTTDTEAVDEIKEGEISESPIVNEVPAKDEVKEPEITSAIVSESETSPADSTGEISDQLLSSEVVAEEKDNSIQANGTPDEIKEDETSEAPIVDEVPAKDEVKEPEVTSSIVSESETSTGDSTEEISDRVLSSEVVAEEKDDSPLANGTPVIEEKVETTKTTELVENIVVPANSKDDNPDEASATKATISPALVKQLRDETGAGMMDCKKALSETGGDIVKAQEFLRKKGLASADKKASRATAEGRVGSYIHDSRIGVLIEVNCETDFVSRGEIFKQLVDDLAMQVAACPQVRYLVTEDVPEEFVNKEREIEMQKEDLLAKPEQIREKIVDGRIRKRVEEFALLEQPYIKNDKMVVKDWVKQTIATIGENIKVKRFVRYNLGEGLEKKSQDFAAEVAAQTAAKESPAAPKDQPVETKKETVEKPPTVVAVSAALVKQLREETGAGMMDCKKALTETGGDIEKAQEYLRKKGLSSADKKSTRLAAEGRISSYVHDTRIGCLIEVNSETDFVARNETFKELVDDLAMQVVACPQVEFVSVEDIPEIIVSREKEIEMGRDDLKSKPENIREKIGEGRISKRLGELALLEQPFIKDDKIAIKDLVKQTVAALGENIRVRRFVRFTLGETTED